MMAALIWQQVAELAPSPEIYQRLADFHLFRKDYPAAIEDLRQVLLYQPSNATLNYRIGLLYATVDPDTALTYLAQAGQMDANLYPASQELLRKIRTSRLFEEPAYTFTAAGRVLASLNEWALAEAAFLRATQLRPNYAEAWAFLGEARQHAIEDPHSANTGLSELQIALRLDPTSLSANLLMGIYWERQGDYQLASGYIQTTIDLDPKNPLLRAELANALAQQGNLPAAQASFEEAIQLAPTDPLFYRLLAEFALEHQIQVREIALPAARMAVILAPNDPLSLDLMGRTMIMLEDYHSAQRFLWQALEIQPEYAPAHLHLGMVLVQQGEMERGRQEFDLAETLGSGTSTATQAQRFLAYYYP
jgi:tetratricopeptide (TPR) repeat protein